MNSSRKAAATGRGRQQGFTLVELMVVIVILAILASVSFPVYTQFRRSTFQGQAQNGLLACAQGMERFAGATFSYAGSGADGSNADTVSPNICDNRVPETGDAIYTINVIAADDGASYELRAIPVDDELMDGDGAYCVLSDGTRGKDANGDDDCADAGEDSWD